MANASGVQPMRVGGWKPHQWVRTMGRGLASIGLATAVVLSPAAASGPPRAVGISAEPLFELDTHNDQSISAAQFRGRPFVVVFGFTMCPSVCPTTLLELTNLLAELGPGAEKLGVFFVTVDPERDTKEQLRDYLTSFDPRIVGMTGDPFRVLAAATAFNAFYEKQPTSSGDYTVDHTTNMYVIDRYGLLARSLPATMSVAEKRLILRRIVAQR